MSRPRKLRTQPSVRNLPQISGPANHTNFRVALVKQVLHGQASALDVIKSVSVTVTDDGTIRREALRYALN